MTAHGNEQAGPSPISADSHVVEGPVDKIWKRQFYATIEDDQAALRTRDLISEDRLMWGSDYPHTDSTWPCSMAVLDEMFAEHPGPARDAITRDTVAQLYGIG